MSNAVYPTLPGLSFGVQRTVLAPPVLVRTTPSQREFRARDATVPRYGYTLQYEFLRSSAAKPHLQTLVGFYNARGGSFESFPFQDPDDCLASAQPFGVGDGTTTAYQLVRSFGGFAEPVTDVAGSIDVFMGTTPCNLLVNGDFELDTDADGTADNWGGYQSGTTGAVTNSRVAGFTGSYAQRVSAANLGTTAGDSAQLIQLMQGMRTRVGQTVTASAAWKVSAACTLKLRFSYYNADSVYIGESAATTLAATVSGSWQSISAVGIVVPPGVYGIAVVIEMSARVSSAGACSMTIDTVQFTGGSAISLFTPISASVGAGGLLTFSAPPAAAAALTWTGGFYRRVRFLRDQLEATKFMQDLWSGKVELLSVKG